MLQQLDDALERMLQQRLLRLRPDQYDISFETPDAEWASRIGKPTLNVFLWDIRRSADESRAGRQRVVVDGQERWRQLLPRMEFQYLVTAWTRVGTDVADSHDLLGQGLVAILGCQVLDGDLRPAFQPAQEPAATVRVARADGKDLAEFWGAIDGKLRPGLNVVVTASVDPGVAGPDAGAPTEQYELSVRPPDESGELPEPSRSVEEFHEHAAGTWLRVAGRSEAIGARVRSPRGVAVVDEHGAFLIDAVPGDEVVIESEPSDVRTVLESGVLSS